MALTPEQIQAARSKLGIKVQDPVIQNRMSELDAAFAPPERFKATGVLGAFQDVAHGAMKEGTKTILGLGHVGQKIQGVVGEGLDKITGDKYDFSGQAQQGVFSPSSEQGMKIRGEMEPQNTAEKIGGGVEKVAEFALPGAAASRVEKAIDVGAESIPGILGAGARILGKGAAQATAAGATEYVASGGDTNKALKTAATAGAARGALATIGEGARAIKLPERLYSTVFKNSKKDMFSELNANGLNAFKKSDPDRYAQLVKDGIIKVAEDGKHVVNDTLAEQALDHGLRGSIGNMANEVVRGQYESEAAVRHIAQMHNGTVALPEEQFQKVLTDVADEYENVGFGEVSTKARELAEKLKASGGELAADDALALRRFLDKLRITSSYDKPVYKLSTSQANLKTLADSVRKRLNSIPGMGEAMKDYAFYIDALDALAQEAKRTGNNQIMGMIDSIFLGEGLSGGTTLPLTAGILRRIVNSASGATRLGSAIDNPVLGPAASVGLETGSAALQSAGAGQ